LYDHIDTRGYVVHVERLVEVQSLYWYEHDDENDTQDDDDEHQ
jgi:hypothetical protein